MSLEKPSNNKIANLEYSGNLTEVHKKELQKFFNMCANISGDLYPVSTSPDGSGEVKRELSDGKKLYFSLQDKVFPDLFSEFKKTNFFKTLYESQASKNLNGVTFAEFTSVLEDSINGDEEALRETFEELAVKPDVFLDALIEIQKEFSESLTPKFSPAKEGSMIQSSDILANMLFIRSASYLNLISS